MEYLVESSKSFSEVVFDLTPVVQRLGFVVFHHEDLGESVRRHGGDYDEESAVFLIGNYPLLEALLSVAPVSCLALPTRLAVFTRDGATWIGCQRPTAQLGDLAGNAQVVRLAGEIEARLIQIIDEAR
ncbi:DUF302 domain-containing protein [Dechloromonas sp.]|uniref:DUF302 domain-containing protein n=1 Tax=Dechloromonas sp. TaxID=1917218 RepID=UPI00263F9128|nr:DUF302 domain-containing protein [Dechloromonas sp.]